MKQLWQKLYLLFIAAGVENQSVNPRFPCSVSSQVCSLKTGEGPTATNPWALPVFHSLGSPLPLAEEDTPKGESQGPPGAAVCSRYLGIEFPATSRLPRIVISNLAKGRDEVQAAEHHPEPAFGTPRVQLLLQRGTVCVVEVLLKIPLKLS